MPPLASPPPARDVALDAPPAANPSPAEAKPYRRHGVYFRAELGPGLFRASSESSTGTRHFTGATPSWALAVGGSLLPGFVMGGVVAQDPVMGLSGTKGDGSAIDLQGTSFSQITYGMMVDVYPDPAGSLHFELIVGPSILNVNRDSNGTTAYDDDPSGIFGSVGGGYEWWLGRGVSFGVALRAGYADLWVVETVPAHVTVFLPAIVATFTAN